MRQPSERWRKSLEEWRAGVESDNWILIGREDEPPTSAAARRNWLVIAMEGDADAGDMSCLARDRNGDIWFVGVVDHWCTAVPMPPRVLTEHEKFE